MKLWDMDFFFLLVKIGFIGVRLVELEEVPHSEGFYDRFNALKSMSRNF